MIMKKIIAIIRNESVERTKSALKKVGIKGITLMHVTGRSIQILKPLQGRRQLSSRIGRTRLGFLRNPMELPELDQESTDEMNDSTSFKPHRMLVIVANYDDVKPIVDTLIASNKTGQQGDGKIFVCPMVTAVRVRNGDLGMNALE